jgi:hypothetical protein
MNSELQKKIFDKYPKMFGDRTKPMTETCMCWGLEVGDGWYDLIDVLCEALTYTYSTSVQVDEEDGKRLGIKPYKWQAEDGYYFSVEPPQIIATQVKEKYGTLRFYYREEYSEEVMSLIQTGKYPDLQRIIDRYSDYINGIVHFAETASGRTCEETGKLGELHATGGTRRGWLKTLNREYAKTALFDQNYVPWSEIPKYEKPNQTV